MPAQVLAAIPSTDTLASEKLIYNGIAFEEVVHGAAFRMPRHDHDEAHLAFLCAGRIDNFKRHETSAVTKSELLFMPPGESHATTYSDSVHAFYVAFSQEWWERVPTCPNEVRTYQNSAPSILARRMHREFRKRDSMTPFMLEGLAMELLVAMAREKAPPEEQTPPAWLQQTREYLHAYYKQALSVSEVAGAVGVHPGHLMRGFRQQYNTTIGDYVRKLRVQEARALMNTNEQSLAEIARSVGFADQSHFCKTFKEVTGMTPTQWQNSAANVRPVQRTFG